MAVRVALNGFGRIGRMVLRALLESKVHDIEIVAINDLGSGESNAHLLKYDSVHGNISDDILFSNDELTVGNRKIKIMSIRDPNLLPWGDLNIDIVAECTGIFSNRDKAEIHLASGAKRVLVSAPSKGADLTVVFGVNHEKISNNHLIVSNASCTTNCLAPVADILNKSFGLSYGYMTTIHAFTGDQSTVDTLHKDLRRARAASLSMIPTSTGAAKAVGEVLPELAGKLDGSAIRVPTPNVSMIDLKCLLETDVTEDEVNNTMISASENKLSGILAVNKLPLVSVDFNHSSSSSIFDCTQTKILENRFLRIVSWYDNEKGYSERVVDLIEYMFSRS